MRTYASVEPRTHAGRRFYAWLKDNRGLGRRILARLRRDGPLAARDFEDRAAAEWYSTGWTSGRNISQMLDYLWTKGKIMVAGRSGLQKLWGVSERCLPEWTPRDRLPGRAGVRRAAPKSP